MSDEPVRLDLTDGVATVTLNRPDLRNALTADISRGVVSAVDEAVDADARCVVVEGEGSAFCAGGDVNAMAERLAGDISLVEARRIIVETTAGAVRSVRECPVPTVAKVDGAAVGAGASLAVACDLLAASESAGIGFGFRRVGLAVDSGASYLLPRIVGENVAKELVYTGEFLDADRAADLGLFNRVYPDDGFDDEVASLVETVATGPTVALAESKRLIDDGLETSFRAAIENEAAAQATAFETRDHEEGARAFMEKRDPEFEGR